MNLKSYFQANIRSIFIFYFVICSNLLSGQQTPQYPISYRLLTPFIFNPAVAGSKDFFSADILTSFYGNDKAQLINGNLRISKSGSGYFSSRGAPKFSNIGVGGALFNEVNSQTHNSGMTGTVSYHLRLDKKALSYLSFGISAKIAHYQYNGNTSIGDSAKSEYLPNTDAGVYYYSKNLFAGFSVTNIFGNYEDKDLMDSYSIPASRHLFLLLGYKAVVSKSLNIILEPSLIVNLHDSFSKDTSDMFEPVLKVYAGNFCAGTYFHDFSNFSFFFQYKYQRFYVATYFELPNDSPYYKKPVRAEFALGFNISAIKSGPSRYNHW
jgi:type IX secretion system PorP/SprF family membrane protein